MREFTAADLRNLFGVLHFVERDELDEALGKKIDKLAWERFPNNFRDIFVKADDRQREGLVDLINRKLART